MLKQIDRNGKELTIGYYSRKLLKHKLNYTITDLECLAITACVEKWHVYLHNNEFQIITDHAALQWLARIKKPTGRLFRWSLKLSMYNYTIKYQKGTDNQEADFLSRRLSVMLIEKEKIIEAQKQLSNTKYYQNIDGRVIRKADSTRIIIPKKD